jgi:glycosyltransferase involved in cell wall biosynthesis
MHPSKPLKVLYIINSLATGGAERLLIEMVPRLAEKGLTTDVFLLDGTKHPFLEALQQHKNIRIFTAKSSSIYNPFIIVEIISFLKKYDLIHVHLFPALYWTALAKMISFSKTPLLYTEHSTTNRRRKHPLLTWTDRIIYRRYSKIVTISTEVKLELIKHVKMKSSRFMTIPNGVAFNSIANAAMADKSEFATDPLTKIIIQVSRFTAQKDQETLIRAIPFIKKPVKLLLVGAGIDEMKMQELVDSLEIKNQVSFLGLRTDIYKLLKMADVAVLSSNYEGLSLSGLEAMASGTPLVASNVPGLSNLVYGAGVLFNHKEATDLATKINKLIDEPEYYNQVATKCLQRAQKYSIEKMVANHLELYTDQLAIFNYQLSIINNQSSLRC